MNHFTEDIFPWLFRLRCLWQGESARGKWIHKIQQEKGLRSNDAGKTGRLLEEKRRLNVAFSRAKMKLIIIGSYKTLFVGSLVVCSILQEITCTVEGGLNICPRILASCTNIPIKTKPINAASTQSENLDWILIHFNCEGTLQKKASKIRARKFAIDFLNNS